MNPILSLGRAIAGIFFSELVIEGRDSLPVGKPVIFTPNHPNGLLDPLLLMFLSPPFRLRFVAKAPLFRIPVFGSLLRSVGAIPVVRKMEAGGDVDYTAFFASCVDALEHGDSIAIFPEGRSLPQSYMAPLKTGPARLFFLARERGSDVKIVPIALNYERGSIFRSRVLVLIAPVVDTTAIEIQYREDPKSAVNALTESIGATLRTNLVQAATYSDKELMLILQSMYSNGGSENSLQKRFSQMKEFETGLAKLNVVAPGRIDRLRNMLLRYQKLTSRYGIDGLVHPERAKRPWIVLCIPLAAIGWLLNAIPYKLVDLLAASRDASDVATFKVIFSIFLFPLAYILEGWAISRAFGLAAAILFGIFIVPLSLLSQYVSDWWDENGPRLLPGSTSNRIATQLERLRNRILNEVDSLAKLI